MIVMDKKRLSSPTPVLVHLCKLVQTIPGLKLRRICPGLLCKTVKGGLIIKQDLRGFRNRKDRKLSGNRPLLHKSRNKSRKLLICKIILIINKNIRIRHCSHSFRIRNKHIRKLRCSWFLICCRKDSFVDDICVCNTAHLYADIFIFSHSLIKFIDQII